MQYISICILNLSFSLFSFSFVQCNIFYYYYYYHLYCNPSAIMKSVFLFWENLNMVFKFCIHKAKKKKSFRKLFWIANLSKSAIAEQARPMALILKTSKPGEVGSSTHTYTHTHKHKLSWHNYVTLTSADYLNVCWRCHPQCAHGWWVVSHLRSGMGEIDPPTHTQTCTHNSATEV